jgi:hypothetical protein
MRLFGVQSIRLSSLHTARRFRDVGFVDGVVVLENCVQPLDSRNNRRYSV